MRFVLLDQGRADRQRLHVPILLGGFKVGTATTWLVKTLSWLEEIRDQILVQHASADLPCSSVKEARAISTGDIT